MNRRVKTILLVSALTLSVIGLFARSTRNARMAAERTRTVLRKQGFKVYLDQFDLAVTPHERDRAAAILRAGQACRYLFQGARQVVKPVGANGAVVLWQQSKWETDFSEDVWPQLRERLGQNRALLDSACQTLLNGPIKFELTIGPNGDIVPPSLQDLRSFALALSTRTSLELHDGNPASAWTNLLALTHFITQWKPEPLESLHVTRANCAYNAQSALWEALQGEGWADNQLSELEQLWASANFFDGLPETAALSRANVAGICRVERQISTLPSRTVGQFGSDLVDSPSKAWAELNTMLRGSNYRGYGIYEDEKALLFYYRDRELELKRAIASSSWSVMRAMPGVTYPIPFQSKYSFGMQLRVNTQGSGSGFGTRNQDCISRAAETEARCRVVRVAIALERFRIRHGRYPAGLDELAPQVLKQVPVDFVNGEPLHYARAEDGHYLLYSIGLDGKDDGGQMTLSKPQESMPSMSFGRRIEPDIVWPRPASGAEAEAERRGTSVVRRQIEGARRWGIDPASGPQPVEFRSQGGK